MSTTETELTYALEQVHRMAISNTVALDHYIHVAELITNRNLSQHEIDLGAHEILFLTPDQNISRFAVSDNAEFTVTIAPDDTAEHLIVSFVSPFQIPATGIKSGPWLFGIPAKLLSGTTGNIRVKAFLENALGDLTFLFSLDAPTALSPYADYPVLQNVVTTQPLIPTDGQDKLRISFYGYTDSSVETIIGIRYSDVQNIYTLTPFDRTTAGTAANVLLGVGPTGVPIIPGQNVGVAGDTHATTTYLTDPHGIISYLRNGVSTNGDTLKKLYDLVNLANTHAGANSASDPHGIITVLRDGVVTAGDSLAKLYNLIQVSGGTSGDAHAQLVASQDPHGIVTALRDGVVVNGNTLKKLYDLIIGVGQLVGDFDASPGLLPTTGSGENGAIDKGDMWHITVAGTLPNGVTPVPEVFPGDVLVARLSGASVGSSFYVMGNTTHQVLANGTTVGSAKLYNEVSNVNTDGSVTQAAINSALVAKQNTLTGSEFKTINTESIFGVGNITVSGSGDPTPLATNLIAGKMKLYPAVGEEIDGAPSSLAVTSAFDTLVNSINSTLNGIVSLTTITFGTVVNSVAEKVVLVAPDVFSIRDSATGFLSKITWENLLVNVRGTYGQWTKAQYITPVEIFSTAGDILFDASLSGNYRLSLLENVTFFTPANINEGMHFVITVIQNTTSPFTVTMGGAFLSADGTVQTIPATLGSVCAIHCRVNSASSISFNIVKHGQS